MMRILLAHCDHRPFEVERFGAAWEAAGGDRAELVSVTPGNAAAVVTDGARWHGLLLTGGPDVEPWRYGQRPTSELDGGHDPRRDALDLDLLDQATARSWPVLAVCYGCQILAVAHGGSVVGDLPRAGLSGHRPELGRDEVAHAVSISSDARFLPAGVTVMVNSRHHQSVAEPGTLRVVGRAPDGVVEAIEGRDPRRFVLGVQWHPEDLRTPEHLGIFRAFRGACAGLGGGGATL